MMMAVKGKGGSLPDYSAYRGVYIEDVDGYLYTESEWDGTKTPNGIAVLTDNCRFVIALEDAYSSYCDWGGYGTKVGSITTITSESEAIQDYDGEAQTTTIINALKGTNDGYVDGAPAAEYCRAYTFPNGKKGYLGAAGEWQAALDNKAAIESALAKCGGESMSYYYWTSTQYSSNSSWYLGWDLEYLNLNLKDDDSYVRAFAPLKSDRWQTEGGGKIVNVIHATFTPYNSDPLDDWIRMDIYLDYPSATPFKVLLNEHLYLPVTYNFETGITSEYVKSSYIWEEPESVKIIVNGVAYDTYEDDTYIYRIVIE